MDFDFKSFKEQYTAEELKRNITKRAHPDNENVFILDYTERCAFKKNWNETTRFCRDLIVNEEKMKIIGRGFSKFFSQRQETKFTTAFLNKHFPDANIEITEKLDGYQAVSFWLEGKLRFGSNGGFFTDATRIAESLWNNHYADVERHIPKDVSLVVEVIHEDLRVVTPYDRNELVLVGAVNYMTNHDYDYGELEQLAKSLNMKVPNRYDMMSYDEAVDYAKETKFDHEGFVVRYGNDKRIKIKGSEYLRVFKLTQLYGDKKMMGYWVNDELKDIIESLPHPHRQRFIDLEKDFDNKKKNFLLEYEYHFSRASKETRKDLGLWVQKNNIKHPAILFKMYEGKLDDKFVRQNLFHTVYPNK